MDTLGPRDSYLRDLKQHCNTDTLTVLGVASDICVRDFIAGALAFGFKVEVVEDACAGLKRQIRQVIEEDFPGQVTILQSEDFIPRPAPKKKIYDDDYHLRV